MLHVVTDLEIQVRALLGRDEDTLSDETIRLNVYYGAAVRSILKRGGYDPDADGQSEELWAAATALFDEAVVTNTAARLCAYCAATAAKLEQTPSAKVEYGEVDWTARAAELDAETESLLTELAEVLCDDKSGGPHRHFGIVHGRRGG